MKQRLTTGAFALTFLLSALWGGNPFSIKIGLMDCPPLRLGWMRFVLGGAVVLAVALARRQSLWVRRGEGSMLAGLGVLFATQLALMNIGQDRTAASHAAIILSAYPLWTAAFAHFFVPGDRLSWRRTLGGLVAYSGVLAVFRSSLGADDSSALLGDALLVGSSVLLGARQVVLSRGAQRIAIPKLLMAQAVVGFSSFAVASALFESEPTIASTRLGLALAYQGFVIAGFAFFAQTWLLKNYSPSRVTIIYMTQPFFGVLFSYALLGEPMGPDIYVGAALVAAGSYLVQR